MKKIYLYAMALGLMFASCEDFLTEYPKNKITPMISLRQSAR